MTPGRGAGARLASFALASMVGLGAAAHAQTLAGERWVVTGVANAPDMTVTALVEDDPAYLGAELVVSAAAIAWNAAATNGEGEYDACPRPKFTGTNATPGEIAVTCDGREWGPGATLDTLGANRMALHWYDGGVLTLTRQDAGG